MKRTLTALIICALCASNAGAQADLFAPNSYTCRTPFQAGLASFGVHIVKYSCTNITMAGLLSVTGAVQVSTSNGDPQGYMFSDGPCGTTGADLAGGAWGWPTGGVFAGTVTVTTGTVVSAGYMPVGYAIVGQSSNPVTIVVGGKSITLTNSFDATIRGNTNAASISMITTGWANIGFVQLASNEWYSALDGIGDQTGFSDASSVTTNAGWLSYTWTCTPVTNFVIMRWDKYGQLLWQTNYYHLSHNGCIPAGSQLRIHNTAVWSPSAQQWVQFGWRAIYGPRPTEAQFRQMEIDARAEYTKRGWGQ